MVEDQKPANADSSTGTEADEAATPSTMANRDEVVIATKVYFPVLRGRNARRLSRKVIMTELDASLRRLGTDYIDPHQIPPLGRPDLDRGDARRPSRRGDLRQGPLHRCIVDLGVAVQQGALHERAPQLHEVHQHAEPVQLPPA